MVALQKVLKNNDFVFVASYESDLCSYTFAEVRKNVIYAKLSRQKNWIKLSTKIHAVLNYISNIG